MTNKEDDDLFDSLFVDFVNPEELGFGDNKDKYLRRNKFKKWLKHQFGMQAGKEAPNGPRDKPAFYEHEGRTILVLRYGTAKLTGKRRFVEIRDNYDEVLQRLIEFTDKGRFDEALEEAAKRVSRSKKAKKNAVPQGEGASETKKEG